MTLLWSSEQPTVPGPYWVRTLRYDDQHPKRLTSPSLVDVVPGPEGLFYWFGTELSNPLEHGVMWAGPVVGPPLERPSAAVVDPTNRIRVQLTFELSVHEVGFPAWLGEIVSEGIDTLIDVGKARSPVILHDGVHYNLHRVTASTLKRRATANRRAPP